MILALALFMFHMVPAAETSPLPQINLTALTARPHLHAPRSVAPAFGLTSTAGASTQPTSDSVNSASLVEGSQNTQALSTIRVPEIDPAKTARFVAAENAPSRRNWLILSFVQHGAAAFDAYSTRQAVSAGAREEDPFMRPFAQTPAIYFASQAGPIFLDFAARRMQRSRNPLLRRTWWLPQSASTGLFLFSGAHNLRVATHNP